MSAEFEIGRECHADHRGRNRGEIQFDFHFRGITMAETGEPVRVKAMVQEGMLVAETKEQPWE